jgi:shikimate dehydrogenase
MRAADFQDFLEFAGAMGVKGASVTIPFKLDALDAAASVDGLTRAVGAANTLRRAAEGWDATNTDVGGFLEPLEALYPGSLQGIRAAVLGAGGAARAVAIALTSRGARVTIHARRREQASHVAASCKVGASEWQLPPHAWDLLVNCTPLGGPTARDASPMPGGPFDGTLVYDLTYGDSEAPLLRDAREAGCLTLDGLPMLIAQAERQFEWWTGTRPRPGVMKQAALRRTARADRVGEAAVEL